MNRHKLVLASGSPRRRELLTQLGYNFDVIVTDVEEARHEKESARDYVQRLSCDKALAGVALSAPDSLVIGSDTIVVLGEQVLEKPSDFSDAQRMLRSLSGGVHQVMTAVTIANKQQHRSIVVVTDVWFKPLTDKEIEDYWLTQEPLDKAGSYGIQGIGGRFVTRIEGSYYAVVGLPLYETDQLIQTFIQS
ncbi:Maf family protein [Vibrio nitrifigilis]|uniref:dTTP/UTP pyrophosphatase n=1 Tax=Vibrio nitrifigilis TaxID=2789781 RepID=A0ABS0GG14_9VIBR|nr:Maf family protein [Vibrio nitrifigilis]MBF9001365.1 septum formation inhibitor Maf [Vibrio nitrifigilis]